MTVDELKATLSRRPPTRRHPALFLALWHDARGDWDKAHSIAQ